MDVDLNLQPPLNEGISNEVNHNMGGQLIPDLNIAPESMVITSNEPPASDVVSNNFDDSVNQLMEDSGDPELVPALKAPPVNFLHLEIPTEDLIPEDVLELNIIEAPMEHKELQMVVYSLDQAA
jgi:hypothetical protein